MNMGMGLITPYPFFMPNIEQILEDALKREREEWYHLWKQDRKITSTTPVAEARFATDEALLALASEKRNMRQIIAEYENQKQAAKMVPQYKNVEPLDQ